MKIILAIRAKEEPYFGGTSAVIEALAYPDREIMEHLGVFPAFAMEMTVEQACKALVEPPHSGLFGEERSYPKARRHELKEWTSDFYSTVALITDKHRT